MSSSPKLEMCCNLDVAGSMAGSDGSYTINPDCLYKELYLGMKTLVKDRKIEWILGNRKLELDIETIPQQNT